MRRSFFTNMAIVAALAAAVTFPTASHAQRGGGGGGGGAPAAQPDETDYNAWNSAKDGPKKILQGQRFVEQYPTSKYCSLVYEHLVVSYYMLQDWSNFYATADKAIERFPDDGNILTLVGWVIPHQANSSDPNVKEKLAKAEAYEKHALELIGNMPQPAKLSPKEFAADKAQLLSQAHSGLGLVYFHNGAYDDSAKELQQATQMGGSPDPTDLYALGASFEGLNRYGEAADAFQKCGAISSDLQDRCKQSASQDKSRAAAQPK
jgi:tetratricopeptide (TPR) repeat protein